ncbi:MAG TPA: hypothetical protein VEJ63_03820 [Planctomycetota bacterium]|nr:hypothetical protein [Planctomycetota bacterium]
MFQLVPESTAGPEKGEPAPDADQRPSVPIGRLGVVLFLASETMFFFAIIGAWITLVNNKPAAIEAVARGLLPHTLSFGLSLVPLAIGSVACRVFRKDPRKFALICVIAGIVFIAWRVFVLVQVGQAGYTARVAVGFAIFYLLTIVHLLHVAAGTVAAAFRATGSTSTKLDGLSPFWVHGTLLGAISYAVIFLTMGP